MKCRLEFRHIHLAEEACPDPFAGHSTGIGPGAFYFSE